MGLHQSFADANVSRTIYPAQDKDHLSLTNLLRADYDQGHAEVAPQVDPDRKILPSTSLHETYKLWQSSKNRYAQSREKLDLLREEKKEKKERERKPADVLLGRRKEEARQEKVEEARGKRQRKTILSQHKEELSWSRERSEKKKERKDEEEMEGDLRRTMDQLKSEREHE